MFAGCEEPANEDWGETGTVSLGICWLIESDDGHTYAPINLSEEYQDDALRVRFEFEKRNDLASTCMQGIIIELNRIEKL